MAEAAEVIEDKVQVWELRENLPSARWDRVSDDDRFNGWPEARRTTARFTNSTSALTKKPQGPNSTRASASSPLRPSLGGP